MMRDFMFAALTKTSTGVPGALIDLKEILVANGITVLAMWFLLTCRRRNRENARAQDRLYDGMCLVNLLGALLETTSFLVDGHWFTGCRLINYLSNSLCFLGTVSIGLLWCLYVDLRLRGERGAMRKSIKLAIIPWAIEVVAVIATLAGTGFLFTVSPDNVYRRGPGAPIAYVSLVIYFAHSVHLAARSRRNGVDLRFFPIRYFVGPCLAGVALQFLFYGITTSWISVAMAMTCVQMRAYAESLYKDELSGLFNRRYLNGVLEKQVGTTPNSLCGIMLDINDFKDINDNLGHATGDRAICAMGNVLLDAIPGGAVAIRYAGDEFVVLLPGSNEDDARSTVDAIAKTLARFNDSGTEPFSLSAAMGYAQLKPGEDPETFFQNMDARMYEAKRAFHLAT